MIWRVVSFAIRHGTRNAYRLFLFGSDLINKLAQPQLTEHSSFVDAAKHCSDAREHVVMMVPKDLF